MGSFWCRVLKMLREKEFSPGSLHAMSKNCEILTENQKEGDFQAGSPQKKAPLGSEETTP